MSGLEAVISSGIDEDADDSVQFHNAIDVTNNTDCPLEKGVHIAANFTDWFYIDEVIAIVDGDTF